MGFVISRAQIRLITSRAQEIEKDKLLGTGGEYRG